uniref:No apical meristem-associated C-terminal domain-containing protein n=1 Tax=Oryza punctata TaxID=4537 RepID=A0A0E0LZR1_ORYPU
MGPRPPSSSSDKKSCQDVPPEKPSSTSFCHPQFPQPAYAMNFPFPPFPHYPPYSQNFQYSNHEDMIEVHPSVSNQKKQSELLTADASWPIEFQLGRHQLMTGTSKLNEHRQGVPVRDEMLEKESRPQDFEVLDNERVAREDEPKKETQPHQGFKARKVSRKRKGKASSSPCEVQEDIKHALYLQTKLNNDREKMSEVQLHLSKEQLELAKIKQDEANVKKETTLYMKYTELLLADTSRFDEFQKAEYEKAVKHIGGILFSNDGN